MSIEYVDPKEKVRLEKEQVEREEREDREDKERREEEARQAMFGGAAKQGGNVTMSVEEGRALFKVGLSLELAG